MIIYVEKTKESTNELLKLIGLFSKVSECKVITLKLVVLLFISNKQIENEILKKIPLTISKTSQMYHCINYINV